MKAPPFWWRAKPNAAARALAPIGSVVGAVASWRLRREPQVRLPIPVLCVGNPTVGGAGKTPIAVALAKAMAEEGRRPVFLTRGYRGRTKGPVLVSSHHGASDVGDEALLLADHFPTVVAKDRAAAADLLPTLGDLVVMDDGFQNPALAKDFALLVVDAAVGVGNGLVTPAGPLRAALAAQTPFANALILTRTGEPDGPLPHCSLPIHEVPLTTHAPAELHGEQILAFAGIGRPTKFFNALKGLGAQIADARALGDHQPLGENLAREFLSAARAADLRIVTTAKDAVRLRGGGPFATELLNTAIVADVRATLPAALIAAALRACGPKPGGSEPKSP